jgi:hypothetical protein
MSSKKEDDPYRQYKSCEGRDVTPLSQYTKDKNLQKKLLAQALAYDGTLNEYRVLPKYNECEFSFENSDWFGVYIEDEAGNFFPRNGADHDGVFYFKIVVDGRKKVPVQIIESTFTMPEELKGKKACYIKDGRCVGEAVPPTPKKERAKKAEKKEEVSLKDVNDIFKNIKLSVMDTSSLEGTSGTIDVDAPQRKTEKQQHDRKYFENMDTKQIIDWMINNMNQNDILGCLRTASLTTKQTQMLTSAQAGSSTLSDSETVQIATSMNKAQLDKFLKDVTKEDLIEDLNNQPNKKVALVNLCRNNGMVYNINANGDLVDSSGAVVNEKTLIDNCAQLEADRVKGILFGLGKKESKGPKIDYIQRIVTPIYELEETAGIVAFQNAMIKYINNTQKLTGDRAVQYTTEELSEEQLADLEEDFSDVVNNFVDNLLKGSSFGRKRATAGQKRVRLRFKKAAKKCKKTCNYRSCMKKELKKKYTVSFGQKRKCVSAAQKRARVTFKKAAKKCKGKCNYLSCMKRELKKCKV